MSEKRAFNGLFRSSLEVTRAGAGMKAGAQASRTVLKIYCKSSLEYLGTLVAAVGDFSLKCPLNHLENFNSEGEKKPGRAIEEVIKRRSRRGQPQPRTKIILVQIFF